VADLRRVSVPWMSRECAANSRAPSASSFDRTSGGSAARVSAMTSGSAAYAVMPNTSDLDPGGRPAPDTPAIACHSDAVTCLRAKGRMVRSAALVHNDAQGFEQLRQRRRAGAS
jgi:hypothetical protein